MRRVQRHEVVDRRRADAAALRWIHPVGEVQHVDLAEKALDAGPPQAAPTLAPEMGEGEKLQRDLDADPIEGGGDGLLALRARGRERDDLVLAGGSFGKAGERSAQIRADPGPGMR
jgi:hypothetical protein